MCTFLQKEINKYAFIHCKTLPVFLNLVANLCITDDVLDEYLLHMQASKPSEPTIDEEEDEKSGVTPTDNSTPAQQIQQDK